METNKSGHEPQTDPADVLLDTDGIAQRYGIKQDLAAAIAKAQTFPGFPVGERKKLVPLTALREWERAASLANTIAAVAEQASVTVIAPPAMGKPGRRPSQKVAA